MALTFRDNKGSALSHPEMDSNFRHFTGSFTNTGTITAAAFAGDGSAITGVTAEWDGSHNGNANITGSLTVTSDVSSSGNVYGSRLTVAAYVDTPQIQNTTSNTILISDNLNVNGVNGNITASSNISASGTITGNIGTFTTLTNVNTTNITASNNISASGDLIASEWHSTNDIASSGNRIAMGTDNRIDLNPSNTTAVRLSDTLVTLNKDTLVTGHITSSGNISASGNLYGTGLTTSGSRVKTFRHQSVGSMSTNPSDDLLVTDELVLITNNNSSAGASDEGNLAVTDWLNNSDPGSIVELSMFEGTGTVNIVLIYASMVTWNVNGTNPTNNTFGLANMDGANDVGAFVKILNLGNNSASIWGTGIYK